MKIKNIQIFLVLVGMPRPVLGDSSTTSLKDFAKKKKKKKMHISNSELVENY